MSFADQVLSHPRPDSILEGVKLPRHQVYHASPADWRDEILYFLLVDRFSDGQEHSRNLLDRNNLAAARPALPNGEPWRWDRWAASGGERWQGGHLQGVTSKLDYLQALGVTTLWLSPVFKQRGHLDTYHGYGIQDFLEVDPRFGNRQALVDLVAAAHQRGMRIILDIIFNHSGANWIYPQDDWQPPYQHHPAHYEFGQWLDENGQPVATINNPDQGVWPQEMQDTQRYTRAGSGDLGGGDIDDPNAEHKRTDFLVLRDFNLGSRGTLNDLARCYKYWIALTDCDGFRIDTLKHVSLEEARNFCGSIKEFASNIGKQDFLLLGEIAGGDYNQNRYLDVLARNLNAALDIGEMRLSLNSVARGLQHPTTYFDGFNPGLAQMGSHRQLGERHVSVLDDHDHVFGEKIRFSSEAASDHQVAAGVALQLFTLGIPCLYYGTEQALAGPEASERHWLPQWKGSDRYLRSAMFGPLHPRKQGRAGLNNADDNIDENLPGFGSFGTAGQHCFDTLHPTYRRIAAMNALRTRLPVLRKGRQYLRPITFFGYPLGIYGKGEIIAWSRILDDEEVLCVLNPHGSQVRGADVLVDADLNTEGGQFTVVFNSAEAAAHRFDLIIADVGFFADVQQDQHATSSFIRAMQLHGAYIFILSDYCKDAANREFLIQQGVDDVMAKPCTPFDLKHAIAKFRILHYKNLELDEAENAAETDRLTGLANRRRLDEFLNALIILYPESKQPFSLVMSDVDHFKHYNDTHGHQMGDVVLEGVAALLAKNLRRGDLAARFGGEEFVIVLPDCGKSAGLELAEKLRVAVASANFPHQDQQPTGNLTATLGVATFPDDALELDDLLKLADDCLYEGKKCGRNVVIGAKPR